MLEAHDTEIRRELAAARVATLHRSARPSQAGPVRRALGNAFVRLGLFLGSDGSVPPIAQHESAQETLAPARVSPSSWWSPSATGFGPTALATELDLAWESAAPYGLRVADPLSRTRSRFGSRPGAPSARSRGSRRPARFDAR
jgi:hypothetical protein